MGKFCQCLRNHIMKMINLEKKNMIPLTQDKNLLHMGKEHEDKTANDKNYCKIN